MDLRKSEIRTESNKLVGYTVEFQNGKKGIGLITSQGRFLGGISIDYIVEAIERKPCIRIDKDIS